MPPAATAAPSVFTARPIQAPATSGSWESQVCATNGRISTSTTANTTTSDDTSAGTTGRDLMAPPVAIAAENDDGDFDVELGPHRVLDRVGEARQKIGDDQAGDQRKDVGALVGQLQ